MPFAGGGIGTLRLSVKVVPTKTPQHGTLKSGTQKED
jgi:hypothetical protein